MKGLKHLLFRTVPTQWQIRWQSTSELEVVELLLQRGAEVNIADSVSETSLMCAASRGHSEIAKALLDNWVRK